MLIRRQANNSKMPIRILCLLNQSSMLSILSSGLNSLSVETQVLSLSFIFLVVSPPIVRPTPMKIPASPKITEKALEASAAYPLSSA
jgi:hypothetical protein